MATATDLTAKAQAAAEQLATRLADRLPDLPKPVLAAIGAADLAGRQLLELFEKVGERTGMADLSRVPGSVGDRVSGSVSGAVSGVVGDARGAAEELPGKVSGMVSELPTRAKEFADQLEGLATRIPGRVQKFTDELPDKVAEVGEQLQPDHLRQTAEAYGQLAGNIFSSLVDRGEKAWSEIRSGGPVPGTVVDSDAANPDPMDPVKVSRERAAAARTTAPAATRISSPAQDATFPKSEPPTPAAAGDTPVKERSPRTPKAKAPVAKAPATKAPAAKAPAAKGAAKPAPRSAEPKVPLAEPVDPATLPEHVVPKTAGTPRPPRRRPTPPAGS